MKINLIIKEESNIKDLEEFWKSINKKKHDRTTIVILATFPKDKIAAYSNIDNYKYEWIFVVKGEIIKALVFFEKQNKYISQKTHGHNLSNYALKRRDSGTNYGKTKDNVASKRSTSRYPRSVIAFDRKEDIYLYLKRTYARKGR